MGKHKYSNEQIQKAVSESESLYDVIRKIGGSLTSGALYRHLSKRIEKMGIDRSHFKKPSQIGSERKTLKIDDILVYDRRKGIRERTVLLYKALVSKGVEERCSCCSVGTTWNNQPLTLEIDHIDGNCLNNLLENLQFVCPNCHSQTKNFGYKGKATTVEE